MHFQKDAYLLHKWPLWYNVRMPPKFKAEVSQDLHKDKMERTKLLEARHNFSGLNGMKGEGDTLEEREKDNIEYVGGIEAIRGEIKNINLIPLDKLTGLTKKRIEKLSPGVFDSYNNLIERLKNENLTYKEFEEIVDEGLKLFPTQLEKWIR